MALNIFVDGAAGTTGLEIMDRLRERPGSSLIALDERARKNPHARREALNDADIVILCLPDEAAKEAVALIDAAGATRVIDASSAHRVAAGWTYGLPELVGREAVAQARFVANPGCYPTGFLALVAPLVRTGLLPRDWPFTVNAVSGYSGGGKALIARFEQSGSDIAFRSYALDLAHKHRAEMKRHAGLKHGVIFAPAVVRAYRGMVVEVPLHLGAMPGEPTADKLRAALSEFYSGSPIITVAEDGPLPEIVLNTDQPAHDGMTLHVRANEGGWHARLIATLDNLGKGASGAAIQNLNLMTGQPETCGLILSA